MSSESITSKREYIFILAAIIAMSPLAIDMYLPAMPTIAHALNAHISEIQNSLSLYLAGYAAGLVLFGPLVDKYGRRFFLIIGLLGFAICATLLPLSVNSEMFLIIRFFQAFLSSAATVVVPGVIRELYKDNTAKGLSYVAIIMMIAPMVAPTMGSFLLSFSSWTSIFYSQGFYAFSLTLIAVYRLPPQLLNKPLQPTTMGFIKKYLLVLSNKQTRLDLLSLMSASMAFFCYITAISFVYLTVFDTGQWLFSVLFAINVMALMLAHFINTRLVGKLGARTMLRIGTTIALCAGFILFLVTLHGNLPVYLTAMVIFPLLGSLSLISVNADAIVLMAYHAHSGTAAAVIGTLKFGVGALAGPLLAILFDASALPFATIMLVAVSFVAFCQWRVYQLDLRQALNKLST